MTDSTPSIDPRDRSSYRAWTAIPIRFGDQDVVGHVNNVAIAAYFENARCMHLIPALEHAQPRLTTVLARITIDYLSELHFPGSVDVGIRITRRGNKSFVITGAIFDGDVCSATCEATMVFFDPRSRRSAVPPEDAWQRLGNLF
jgi:acyl-CoA thioester hydrolase